MELLKPPPSSGKVNMVTQLIAVLLLIVKSVYESWSRSDKQITTAAQSSPQHTTHSRTTEAKTDCKPGGAAFKAQEKLVAQALKEREATGTLLHKERETSGAQLQREREASRLEIQRARQEYRQEIDKINNEKQECVERMKQAMDDKMRQKNVLVFLLGSALILVTFVAILLSLGIRATQCRIDEERLNAERLEAARLETVRLESVRLEAARLESVRQEVIKVKQEDCNNEIARIKEEARSRTDWLQRDMWYNQLLLIGFLMMMTVSVTRRELFVRTVVSLFFIALLMGWLTLAKFHPRWNMSTGPIGSSFSCLACTEERIAECKVNEPTEADCFPKGLQKLPCDCCNSCRNSEGERCGGPWGILGKCAVYLYCKLRPLPPDGYHFGREGTCSKYRGKGR